MKSTVAAIVLAGAVNAAPQAAHHRRGAVQLGARAAELFNPQPYHPHHYNGTMPLGNPPAPSTGHAARGAGRIGAAGNAVSPSPTPTPMSIVGPANSAFSPPAASSASSSNVAAGSSKSAATGKVQAAGINIAGCDFGCDTSGNCNSGSSCPTEVGPTQMQHFSSADGLNIFRLPVGWQYLVANTVGGTLDATYLAGYDGIVQACLKTNSRCIIDIHNYARWNGQIIGQGGPSNDNFANLWSQLAKKYADAPNVVFGIMNEPHDLDINQWATTVQAAVTAIRTAGATSQWILLPGTGYTSAGGFQTSSAPALSKVTNLDGSTDNLIYDVHNYYDSDSSGTNAECVTDHVSDRFQPLGDYLRTAKRQAFVSELGGGNTASCEQYVCSSLDFINSYSDVYLGWTGWGAGSFEASYTLAETPNGNTDTALVSQCIAGKFK